MQRNCLVISWAKYLYLTTLAFPKFKGSNDMVLLQYIFYFTDGYIFRTLVLVLVVTGIPSINGLSLLFFAGGSASTASSSTMTGIYTSASTASSIICNSSFPQCTILNWVCGNAKLPLHLIISIPRNQVMPDGILDILSQSLVICWHRYSVFNRNFCRSGIITIPRIGYFSPLIISVASWNTSSSSLAVDISSSDGMNCLESLSSRKIAQIAIGCCCCTNLYFPIVWHNH